MRKLTVAAALGFGLAACSDVPVTSTSSLAPTSASFAKGGDGIPIPGRYIVRFRDDEPDVDGRAGRLATRHAGRIRHLYRSALKGMTLELSDAAVAALRNDPSVLSVEQDQTITISATQTGATWGIDRIDQRTLPLSGSYVYNADGSGVTVYIIDTGMNLSHTEFTGRASTGYDAVTAGGTAADCNGHGTHVAGTVGGTTYGVAKKAQLVAVRVLDCAGSGTTSGVIAGIDWVTARKNANPSVPSAANMSLGGGVSAALNTAVRNSVAAGVVYAVAAGNDGGDACLHSPAAEPAAITVGATDIADGFASFSNRGSCVDINAPGVNITSSWYDTNTATNTISGTSMATPHVAGAIALYLQVNPTATPEQVDAALKTNGSTTTVPAGTTDKLLYSGFITAAPYVGAPVSSFTASCSGMTCSFDGSTSKAEGSITYAWNFGDNTTAGNSATASRTYAAAGPYTVTLLVTDASGRTASSSQVVNPTATPIPSFTKSCSSRTCTFNASATTGATSYSWNFGDGTTGTGVSVSHQFARNKSYTVTLTATGPGGSASATQPVTCTRTCS
jgi:subtilisin family serine protease